MTTPRRSRNWIWFFGVLAGLTVTAIGIEVWYNLRQQLRPGALAAARQRWRDQGPASYQAQYLVKRHDGSEQRYVVVVEEGKVASVRKSTGQILEPGAYPFDRVESLFDHIEEQLREDGRSDAPRVYASAVFDPKDGHVLRYIRSLRSPRERLEVNVLLRPVEEKRTCRDPSDAIGGLGKPDVPRGTFREGNPVNPGALPPGGHGSPELALLPEPKRAFCRRSAGAGCVPGCVPRFCRVAQTSSAPNFRLGLPLREKMSGACHRATEPQEGTLPDLLALGRFRCLIMSLTVLLSPKRSTAGG